MDSAEAIARAEEFVTTNFNYLDNASKAVVYAHLAVATAMTELVAVSQPAPEKPAPRRRS
jgi:hypothetical protein